MHGGSRPQTIKSPLVGAKVGSSTFNLVVCPLACISRGVGPLIEAPTTFPTLGELTNELGLVGPALNAMPILQVIHELAFILCTVAMHVNAKTMGNILLPLTSVHVTIAVAEHAH